MNARPDVAPYSTVLPTITFSSARERGVVGRADREHTARQPLADVVVRVADERQLEARARATRRTTAPPSRAARTGGCSSQPVLRDVMREQPADRAVHVAHVERSAARVDQLPVERVVERRGLRLGPAERRAGRDVRGAKQMRQVDAARLPVRERVVRLEQVDAPDEILEPADCRATP